MGNFPAITPPDRRLLRTFAFDPMTTRLTGKYLTVDVPYEPGLRPGPDGELLQVVDYDAARDLWYQPVDLNDPAILAQDGLRPTEGDPRSHQQAVYAVAMSVTERFERFLGRRFRWRADKKLRIVPHAFEGRNAYFDPTRRAVLFGYYRAEKDDPGANLPEQVMFTCLSVDVVAHEVTHAIIHRLRKYYLEATNPDVFAFHEAFADLIALFNHFAYPEAVASAVASSKGELRDGSALLDLASEFGVSTGRGAALRSAIGSPRTPDAFLTATEPHERGACFVAAVFDAFLDTYTSQIADLRRLATGGTGVLPPGALPPDLVNRVTSEAIKNADRILGMVVRCFDYLPVIDVTFGDVVRAIITADRSLFPEDAAGIRSNLVESLRRRGIFPTGISSLADDALVWPAPPVRVPEAPLSFTTGEGKVDLASLILEQTQDLDMAGEASNLTSASVGNELAVGLRNWAIAHATPLQLDSARDVELVGIHVAFQQASDRQPRPVVVAQFAQRHEEREDQTLPRDARMAIRSGTTVIARVDGQIEYVVAKPLPVGANPEGQARLEAVLSFADQVAVEDALSDWTHEPAVRRLTFARLHAEES